MSDLMQDTSDHEHEHEHGPLVELVTLRDWLRYAVTRFNRASLFFGHGCADAYDEAVWLLLHTLDLPLDRLEPFLDACITGEEREALLEVIERRINERLPAAYLTGEAWLGDFRFKVDPRVIVPRSFFAELLGDGLEPWIQDVHGVSDALDLCTGSGCLAILMSHVFPNAQVVGADLSEDALSVARDNVSAYGLEERVELLCSDVYSGMRQRRFDLIISNPPYVTREAMDALPPEYLHEPRMALAAGDDGMDVVRRIIAGAREHLKPGGVLAVEVGHNRALVDAAFPELPLVWLSAGGVEDCIFLITEENLPPGAV
ncbi:50S ribosomal protein L3 N(5)-glutamine methyltransferase [Azoarcus taiwanensis]|uniref:Ribosomal protein uL3 glutamine methyltransferase n=1 Tax=Azoarcus taiwanensis TaxID=666964 RepID=A0A972FC59_9RHOO|nr:50S ribosomal protein L3 N(5)-glutamine methyltransferase [Azoarcus taiwanensis]NMG04019.1 50S ribosomal protein L3 N(5)-glutamine methyltransferase [Azoarcus taiwanensis]